MHRGGIADRGDDERRREDPAVQQQGVADTAYRARRNDPDAHDRHRLGAAGPERVDDGLHVLLVHDRSSSAVHPSADGRRSAARRVVQRHGEPGRVSAAKPADPSSASARSRAVLTGVHLGRAGGVLVHLGTQLGAPLLLAVAARWRWSRDELDELRAPVLAQRGAVGGRGGRREQQAGDERDQRHADATSRDWRWPAPWPADRRAHAAAHVARRARRCVYSTSLSPHTLAAQNARRTLSHPAGPVVRADLTTLAVEHYSPRPAFGIPGAAQRWVVHHCRPQESTVPKSPVRKKKVYTPPTDIRPAANAAIQEAEPGLAAVTAVVLILFGLAWLVVFYLSEQSTRSRAGGTGTSPSASPAWSPRWSSCLAGDRARAVPGGDGYMRLHSFARISDILQASAPRTCRGVRFRRASAPR